MKNFYYLKSYIFIIFFISLFFGSITYILKLIENDKYNNYFREFSTEINSESLNSIEIKSENSDINILNSKDNKFYFKFYFITSGKINYEQLKFLNNNIIISISENDSCLVINEENRDMLYRYKNLHRVDIIIDVLVPKGKSVSVYTENGTIRIGKAYWGPILKNEISDFNTVFAEAHNNTGKYLNKKYSESGKIYKQ